MYFLWELSEHLLCIKLRDWMRPVGVSVEGEEAWILRCPGVQRASNEAGPGKEMRK